MTTPTPNQTLQSNTLEDLLRNGTLIVGEPDVSGPLAVYPLFGPEPRFKYSAFAEATTRGTSITELEDGASVNDLVVANQSPDPVLLYEGEEVLGAQQNRTFDVTVLVAAGKKIQVPVSCVEQGRWDGGRHDESFAPAPQMSYPELRRLKNQQVRERVAAGMDARAEQGAVWNEIEAKASRLETRSRTGAMHDIYEARRTRLSEMAGAFPVHDGQLGAVAAIGGRLKVLDMVSRPEVFGRLQRALVQGYALDAIEAEQAEPPSRGHAEGFIALALGAQLERRPAIGLGRELRFAQDGVAGSGLEHEGELIQLGVFPG